MHYYDQDDEFEPATLLSETTPVARKEYDCLYGDKIKPGESYYRRAYIFEGEFHSERMHNPYENYYEPDPPEDTRGDIEDSTGRET